MTLTKLTLSGTNKDAAILNFKKGLNVISGDSDTGKTYAFQCLDYILGAEKTPKEIAEANGYTIISLDFDIDGQQFRLERCIGSAKVDVIHNGEKTTLSNKHNPTSLNNVSRYLLSLLLGHEDTVAIKKSAEDNRTLSFRDVMHLCSVAETDIIAEHSTFQSNQVIYQTARKSVFKYILTGQDDLAPTERVSVDDENLKRAGVVQFLEKKRAAIKAKIEEIEANQNYRIYSESETLPEMIAMIKEIRKSISGYQRDTTRNLVEISNTKKACFADEIQISEFKKLRCHYVDEINRIGLLSTHADFLTQLPQLACPICNQSFDTSLITSDNEDALFGYFSKHRDEIEKKILDLDASINDIADRLLKNCSKIRQLESINSDLAGAISEAQHKLESLSDSISIIRQLDAMKKTLEIYKQELETVERDIIAYSEKVKKTTSRKPQEIIMEYDEYCHAIESLLKRWGFSEDTRITFDANTLDLSINGKPRSSWGKGYRAFIMSAMVIGLMRFCCSNNRLHPGFVVIDSPLVSLKERKKDENDNWVNDYMEKKMIEDILAHDDSVQVIIIENKDLRYGFDYNYIEFSHDGSGRKGFIPQKQQ